MSIPVLIDNVLVKILMCFIGVSVLLYFFILRPDNWSDSLVMIRNQCHAPAVDHYVYQYRILNKISSLSQSRDLWSERH